MSETSASVPRSPVGLFILATVMATVAATIAATAVLTNGDEAVECTCSCEDAAVTDPAPAAPRAHSLIPVPMPAVPDVEDPDGPAVNEPVTSPHATKRVPRVRQAKATVRGSLDKDIVRRIVRAHVNEVRYCYNQGLVRDAELQGRVSVQFTIGPTGKVPVAVVQNSSIDDRGVSNCIAKAVKRWKFPKPQGGGNVVVTYPFVLSPG